jgi:hypothetical protein
MIVLRAETREALRRVSTAISYLATFGFVVLIGNIERKLLNTSVETQAELVRSLSCGMVAQINCTRRTIGGS